MTYPKKGKKMYSTGGKSKPLPKTSRPGTNVRMPLGRQQSDREFVSCPVSEKLHDH